MNNLHYYTALIQNVLNTRHKINEIGLKVYGQELSSDYKKGLNSVLKALTEELFNHFEAICELYFSLNIVSSIEDHCLQKRIINLHKVEISKLSQIGEVKESYNFIHKFLEL